MVVYPIASAIRDLSNISSYSDREIPRFEKKRSLSLNSDKAMTKKVLAIHSDTVCYSPAIGARFLAFSFSLIPATTSRLSTLSAERRGSLTARDRTIHRRRCVAGGGSECQFREERETEERQKRDEEWESQLVGEGVNARAYVISVLYT